MRHYLEYANTPTFSTYKNRAKKNSVDFSLSNEEFEQISRSSCFYCGKKGPNEIDRKDNSKGYIKEMK